MRGRRPISKILLLFYVAFTVFVFGFSPDRKGVGVVPAHTVECRVDDPFTVDVVLETAEIAYDFSRSKSELTAMQGSALRPDQATAGLRADKPQIRLQASWNHSFHPLANVSCAWYKTVVATISLKPEIYIANELASERCAAAVIDHEIGHVRIDREILNQHQEDLRVVLRHVAAQNNPVGPLPYAALEQERVKQTDLLQGALAKWMELFQKEMDWRHEQHDSPQEYGRLSEICKYGVRW